MNLSQDRLNAFYAISRLKSFTKAANELGLTQSALSHRIRNLEQQLEAALFIRDSRGVRLTEAGVRLSYFCKTQDQLETELIGDLKRPSDQSHKGYLRIGGASTVLWSVVVPALSRFMNQHVEVNLEMMEREINELPNLLQTGAVDFIITCGKLERPSFEGHHLGLEANVLVESRTQAKKPDIFLDHDPSDQTTFRYHRHQGIRNPDIRRRYMDNITGIIAGVESGLGKAVLPKHLLRNRHGIKVVSGQKEMRTPVYLYHIQQPFYSKLHRSIVSTLVENAPDFLKLS